MATVVDSLIVTLGLDPKGFTQGRKQAVQDLIDTRTQANRIAKDVESSGKRASAFFSQIRNQALLLFATLAGGKGLKQFISDVTNGDAALGRMALVAGTTTEALSRWKGVAAATGGSAEGVASSINGLNQSLVRLSLTGESEIIPYFRALQAVAPQANLSLEGANGNMKTAIELLPQLHKAVQGMDAARATAILSGMGIGQDLINVLISSDKQFNKFMEDQKRWGTVTKEQSEAAQRLQYSTAGVIQAFTTLGRLLVNQLSPYLERVNTRLTDLFVWFQAHPREMEQAFWAITAAVTALALAFGGPIAIIGVLTAAVALLYNDWLDYNQTGKSTFGDFWRYVEDGWKSMRDSALETWNNVKGAINDQLSQSQAAGGEENARFHRAYDNSPLAKRHQDLLKRHETGAFSSLHGYGAQPGGQQPNAGPAPAKAAPQGLASEDQAAIKMAQDRIAKNPNDAVAKKVLQLHGM